jgi:hypothetical protein
MGTCCATRAESSTAAGLRSDSGRTGRMPELASQVLELSAPPHRKVVGRLLACALKCQPGVSHARGPQDSGSHEQTT